MADIALAVIGGTGVYRLADLQDVETRVLDTRFGAPSGPVRIGTLEGRRVAFLARHGEGHSVPPHQVNYRANLQVLKDIGAPACWRSTPWAASPMPTARACWPVPTS